MDTISNSTPSNLSSPNSQNTGNQTVINQPSPPTPSINTENNIQKRKLPLWIKVIIAFSALIISAWAVMAIYAGYTSITFFGSIPNCMSRCESATDRNTCMIACTNKKDIPPPPQIVTPTLSLTMEDQIKSELTQLPYNFTYNILYGENIPPIEIGNNKISTYLTIQVTGKVEITASKISDIGKQACVTIQRMGKEVSHIQVETVANSIGNMPVATGVSGTCQEWQDNEVYESLQSTNLSQ